MTATSTMARPASSARPTSIFSSPLRTDWPRPGEPTSAAMTTTPKAIMITWLTPRRMAGRASGHWIFPSTWRSVAPLAAPTSISPGDTALMPWAVRRTAGARAKMTVAMTAAGAPMSNSSTVNSR